MATDIPVYNYKDLNKARVVSGTGIASTVFQTGAKDDLAVVDVYSTTDSKIKTSLINRVSDIGDSVSKFIVSNPDLLHNVADSFVNKGGMVAFDDNLLLDAVAGSQLGPDARSMIPGLCNSLRSSMGSAYGNNSMVNMGINGIVGSTIDALSPKNLACSRSISNYLGKLTGDINIAKTINLDGEYAVLGAFMSEAVRMGAVGAFQSMLDAYSGRDEYNYVVRYALATSVQQAVYSGNLDVINKLVVKLGSVAFLAEMPDAINRILAFYHFPVKLKSTGYKAELTKLVALLTLIDPNWFSYNKIIESIVADVVVKTTQVITKLEPFTYASENAITLFMLDDLYKVEVMIAPSYPLIIPKATIQSMYPFLLFPKEANK